MKLSAQLAKDFRAVHFGGNWTAVNLKETVEGLTWEQATSQVYSFNTIVALVYHMNYFVSAVLKVLQGEPLDASDKLSFNHPTINSQEDWESLLQKTWDDAENFARLVEQLPEQTLWKDFTDTKYGHYYSNIQGVIEHIHYHLGQVVIIKKIIYQVII